MSGPAGTGRLGPHLRGIVRIALETVSQLPGEIAVFLADDGELRALNRRWRGIDRATDVLSFPDDESPPPEGQVSGDIVISLDRVHDQARRYRVTSGSELGRLLIHGTLHLAGYDHQTATDRRYMRSLEEKALGWAKSEIIRLDRMMRRGSER